MKKIHLFALTLFSVLSLNSLNSQTIKAAIIHDPVVKLVEFYQILSERSNIKIQQVPLLRQEVVRALEEGIVDIAIVPDNEHTFNAALIQSPVFSRTFALIGESGFMINEYNMMDLRTVAVFVDDEPVLNTELLDRFTISPRIQKARHYDSLVKILATSRVTAIFIPLKEFERSVENIHEDMDKFGQPFILGSDEEFIALSRRKADLLAPLMDRLIVALEEMKRDGTMDDLNNSP